MHANYLLQTNITTYIPCWECVTLILIVPLLLGKLWKSSEEQQCERGVGRKINVESVCVCFWQLWSSHYCDFIVVWIPDCLCKIGSGVGFSHRYYSKFVLLYIYVHVLTVVLTIWLMNFHDFSFCSLLVDTDFQKSFRDCFHKEFFFFKLFNYLIASFD